MTPGRYVVLGLAPARADWFTRVSRWATAGSVPVEFLKCVSVDDLRARIDSGRPFSAALLDARLPVVERDLLASLTEVGIAGIVVETADDHRDWVHLGASARVDAEFDRAALLDALASHGRLIDEITERPTDSSDIATDIGWLGPLVAITGRSGSGASTLSAALAQQLAADPRYSGGVTLVDLARRAHQAVLHDARDVVPGIQEIMDLHRTRTPSPSDVLRLTFDVHERGYRLVLGLRHPRDWVTARSRSFAASLESLRRASRIVVADTDPDLEGEAETGSFDIEDRHLLGRRTMTTADLVVLVAHPTLTGLHGLAQSVEELRQHGIGGDRLLVAVNRSPRRARTRAELSRVITELTRNRSHPDPHLGPVFVPERRGLDTVHRDLARLPAPIGAPLAHAVLGALDRTESTRPILATIDEPVPVAVTPGSLGHWREAGP